MDKDTFLRMQYEALRQEILATQKRHHQTLGFGALSVPATSYLAVVHEIPELSLMVPFLVLGIALMYLANNHGIIRCGEYIREHIEKKVAEPGLVGWETWLEEKQEGSRRITERYITLGFYLMFLLYFLAAIYMAWRYAGSAHGLEVALSATSVYVALGAAAGFHIVRSLRLTTMHSSGVKSRVRDEQTELPVAGGIPGPQDQASQESPV